MSTGPVISVIVAAGVLFGIAATLARAAWMLSRATVSQLEATKLNTLAIRELSQRIGRVERSVARRAH